MRKKVKNPFDNLDAELYYFYRQNAAAKKTAKIEYLNNLNFALNETFNCFKNRNIILKSAFLNVMFECFCIEKKQAMSAIDAFLLNKNYKKLLNKNDTRGRFLVDGIRTIIYINPLCTAKKAKRELERIKNAR